MMADLSDREMKFYMDQLIKIVEAGDHTGEAIPSHSGCWKMLKSKFVENAGYILLFSPVAYLLGLLSWIWLSR